MLNTNERIIKHKVGLLNLAEELGNVSKACQVMGLSRDTFYRYMSDQGKTCHQKLGTTTDIDLDEARRLAKRQRAEITLGTDPRGGEKTRKAVPTFDAFFQYHYLPHCKVHNRGWRKKEQMFDLRVKNAFGTKRLEQIHRHDITTWHASLREDDLSPAYSDRFLALLHHILAKTVEDGLLEMNPASGIKLFNPDNRVEHYLDAGELESLLMTLRNDKNRTVCRIALFLMSTGARLNEVLQARWKDVDRDNRVWRIPAVNSKSKRVRSVPLNDSAIEVLDKLDTEEKFEHLFINRKTCLPYTTIHKAWSRIRADAGLPHLRIHDLRHQYASFLVNGGRTLYEVQQILGNSDPVVTQRYAHLSSRSLQEAANSASVAIKGATADSTPATSGGFIFAPSVTQSGHLPCASGSGLPVVHVWAPRTGAARCSVSWHGDIDDCARRVFRWGLPGCLAGG